MPLTNFLLLIASVILLAGVTIWAVILAGPTALAIVLPIFLFLALIVRWRDK